MNTAALRTLIIYGIILPLAVFIGYMLSGDLTESSFAILAGIGFILLLPALLKWHYAALLFSLNSTVSIFFLPGKPTLWMLMGAINAGIAVLYRIMQKRRAFISAPSITFTLLALLAVVVITGKVRGGFGSMALGGASYGGKGYYYIIGGIIAYFGLTSQSIPLERARSCMILFLLPRMVFALGSMLIYFAGSSFYFLYLLVPANLASTQAATEFSGGIVRYAALGPASLAISDYLLAMYGIRGVLAKWWRLLLLMAVVAVGTFAGFRTNLVQFVLLFAVLFFLEGLLRSPIFPVLILISCLGFAAVTPFASKLPGSVQRTLSVLPLDIDPSIRRDAESSTEWRVAMWRTVVPDLPKYFWVGKGYAVSPTDIYLAQQALYRGRTLDFFEGTTLANDYHSGPLSLYVPFGFFGSLAFLAFLIAGLRAVILNYRHGNPELRILNRFLCAYFITKVIFFFGVFGGFYADLPQLAAVAGLNIAMNGGICRRPEVAPRPVLFRGNLQLKAV